MGERERAPYPHSWEGFDCPNGEEDDDPKPEPLDPIPLFDLPNDPMPEALDVEDPIPEFNSRNGKYPMPNFDCPNF